MNVFPPLRWLFRRRYVISKSQETGVKHFQPISPAYNLVLSGKHTDYIKKSLVSVYACQEEKPKEITT